MKKLIVFDLGGVLVEFNFQDMMNMTQLSETAMWEKWLLSETVREFETGRTQTETFARDLVAEFNLSVSPTALLERYATWMVGMYPGAEALLAELAPDFALACLTNTNALIWSLTWKMVDLEKLFDYRFASHEMGCLKPDPEAYEYIIESIPYAREEILFFDDNRLNVEGARAVGLTAFQVKGPAETRAKLVEQGLIR
jgi:putative hydrolase of the HAD superfamily